MTKCPWLVYFCCWHACPRDKEVYGTHRGEEYLEENALHMGPLRLGWGEEQRACLTPHIVASFQGRPQHPVVERAGVPLHSVRFLSSVVLPRKLGKFEASAWGLLLVGVEKATLEAGRVQPFLFFILFCCCVVAAAVIVVVVLLLLLPLLILLSFLILFIFCLFTCLGRAVMVVITNFILCSVLLPEMLKESRDPKTHGIQCSNVQNVDPVSYLLYHLSYSPTCSNMWSFTQEACHWIEDQFTSGYLCFDPKGKGNMIVCDLAPPWPSSGVVRSLLNPQSIRRAGSWGGLPPPPPLPA